MDQEPGAWLRLILAEQIRSRKPLPRGGASSLGRGRKHNYRGNIGGAAPGERRSARRRNGERITVIPLVFSSITPGIYNMESKLSALGKIAVVTRG